MTGFIAAMHDPGGEHTFGDKPGWIVHTEALEHSGKGDYSRFVAMGFRNIVRLNQGYGGLGTIPTSDRYDEFAAKCASFVTNSPGIDWVMIGNEPNHAQEWPHGQQITPTQYAKCFDLCYSAIRNTGRPVKVMAAAVAPWNQQAGDWLAYYRAMLTSISKCDGFSLHAYTHGTDPALIYSDHKVESWYWHFRTYLDQLQAIADVGKYALNLPAFITETDQDETWRDANSGWVQNAFAEINAHNGKGNTRKIHCVALYRWQQVPGDKWGIEGKNGVIDDFKAAAQRGYSVDVTLPPTTPNPPDPPQPPTITPPPASNLLDWDERLTVRGCTLQPALVPSEIAPLVRVGRWFNEEEAQGRVNIFVRLLDENGNLAIGVPVTFVNGGETKPTERKSDPWLASKGLPAEYSLDFAMYNTAPAYGIRIEGYSGDVIDGCGLGSIEQPDWNIHTAYYFEWKLSKVPEIITPPPVEPPVEPPVSPFPPTNEIEIGSVIAPAGLNLRAAPSTNATVLGTLAFGSTVLHDGERDGWLHVIDGWVSEDYVGDAAGTEVVLPSPALPAVGHLIWPVLGGRITQRFGDRYEYYKKHFDAFGHNGLDFGLPAGSPIYATADGIVSMAQDDPTGYGLFIRLYHPHVRLGSLYAHCSQLMVQEGTPVIQGQIIAKVGSTGNSTGDHLHWELCAQDNSGYINVSHGHLRGRANPEVIMWLLGTPPVYR
jgi:hypothetical protein